MNESRFTFQHSHSLRYIGVILNFSKLTKRCVYLHIHAWPCVCYMFLTTFVIEQLSPAHRFHECMAKLNHPCNKVLHT